MTDVIYALLGMLRILKPLSQSIGATSTTLALVILKYTSKYAADGGEDKHCPFSYAQHISRIRLNTRLHMNHSLMVALLMAHHEPCRALFLKKEHAGRSHNFHLS